MSKKQESAAQAADKAKKKVEVRKVLSWIWQALYLVVSVVIFPIGLARLFRYYDSKKTPGAWPDRFFFGPIWYFWNTFLKYFWELFWVLFCIVVFPVGLFYVARWIATGSAKKFWGDFGSFLIGSWSRTDGNWDWMRFVSLPDVFHLHIVSWPITALAVIQYYVYGEPVQWVGIAFLALHILAARTFFTDIRLQRFLVVVFVGIPVLLLADTGIKLMFQSVWAHIEGSELPYVNYTFPEYIAFGKNGVIVPFWDWVTSGKLLIESWMLFVYSLIWWYFVIRVLIDAAFNKRVELDSRTLIMYRWGEEENTIPVYMRSSKIIFPDIFEALLSGSGDLILDTRKGKLRYKNVFGLLWLQLAYNGLRNSKTTQERRAEARLRDGEDEAELVRDFDKSMEETGHGQEESDDDDDHEVSPYGDEDELEAEGADDFFEEEGTS